MPVCPVGGCTQLHAFRRMHAAPLSLRSRHLAGTTATASAAQLP